MKSIRSILASLAFLLIAGVPGASLAQDCMIGEVKYFAGNFAPRGWAFAEGQLIAISSNSAMFSILGTTFGGDGRTTFGLPDLRGRAPIGPGTGAGLSTYRLGQRGGAEQVTLNTTQIPSHNHAQLATSGRATSTDAGGTVLGAAGNFAAGTSTTDKTLAGASIGNTGGGREHENRPPYLAIHPIICMVGLFPSRS